MRALWRGGEPFGRMLFLGALVYLAYGVLAVLVNGVVQDEVVVPAQILTRAVGYPAGHPHELFYPRAYSLFHYLAAAQWRVTPDAGAISFVRNALYVFASAFVPFALTLLWTRKPWIAHLAAVLTLSEGIVRLQGVYPMWVFPCFYGHGHFGIHLLVLAVVLLVAGAWRSGGFLLGAMPAIHPGMALVLWPWAALWLLFTRRWRQRDTRLRLAVSCGIGILVCVLLAVAVSSWVGRAPQAPYDVTGDAERIYRQFTASTDKHSRPFALATYPYLANPVAFVALGALLLRSARREAESAARVTWILVLGALVWALVYGAWLWLAAIGPLPASLNAARPFRFSNVSVLLLLPMALAAISAALDVLSERERRTGIALLAVLAAGEALLLAIDRERLVDSLVFVVLGLAIAFHLRAEGTRALALGALAAIGGALAVVLATRGATGAYWFAGSAALAWSALFVSSRIAAGSDRPSPALEPALLAACALAGGLALFGTKVSDKQGSVYDAEGVRLGRWDTITEDDRRLAEWLDANAEPDELILPAVQPRTELQAKTGHPVLLELETLWLMTYVPALSPVIGAMVKDLYGVDYSDAEAIARLSDGGRLELMRSTVWNDVWRERPRSEWQALGAKYHFRLVLSTYDAPLELTPVLRGSLWTLYTIP